MIDTKNLQRAVLDFIECLDQERFYDAHEALEVLWFPLRKNPSDEVKLLRGYINASVSFELYKKGRFSSCEKVWKNFIKYQCLVDTMPLEHRVHYKNAEIYILKIRDTIEKNSSSITSDSFDAKCSR
ncbi:MAG: DUF309 domain-containing protein [Campylobacterota bacterium]|nr:DUF309 domain-containing protein [Campylobacterota bacterium]